MMIYIPVNLELQPEVNMRKTKKAEEKNHACFLYIPFPHFCILSMANLKAVQVDDFLNVEFMYDLSVW